jgi:hypothetical protein
VLSSVYERDYVTVPPGRRRADVPIRRPSWTPHRRGAAAADEGGGRQPRVRKAAALRDRIKQLRSRDLGLAGSRADGMNLFVDWLKAALLEVQEYLVMVGKAARATVTRPFYFRDVVEQFDAIGVGSMTVVLLTGHVHRHGAGAAVGHHARPVRRALDGRAARERVDGEGAGARC